MAQIRDEGKINDHTYLIDAVHEGMSRAHGGSHIHLGRKHRKHHGGRCHRHEMDR